MVDFICNSCGGFASTAKNDTQIIMINTQRLSKIIQERESKMVQNHLLSLYQGMTQNQRSELKEFVNKIKNG